MRIALAIISVTPVAIASRREYGSIGRTLPVVPHATAHTTGTEIARATTEPYTKRPSLLMEFITGGSLASHVKRAYKAKGGPDIQRIADAYGAVAAELGRLHERNRKAQPQGRTRSEERRVGKEGRSRWSPAQ